MDRQSNTGTANPDTGNPDAAPRAGARQAADTMRITDGGTSGEGPVVNASEPQTSSPQGQTCREGGCI